MPSPYQLFVNKWKDCRQCELHKTRTRIVLARGSVPCDVLFVGEAPGVSEDILGQPFTGPAGQLLNRIIGNATNGLELRYAFTNLVCCLPVFDGKKDEPDDCHVKACSQRLQEFIKLCDTPAGRLKLIVSVGSLSATWLDQKYRHGIKLHRDIKQLDIIHPAAILRDNTANQWHRERKATVTLRTALEEL